MRSTLRMALEAATAENGRGQDTAWVTQQKLASRRPRRVTSVPPCRSRKHGSKAGRRKGGGRGGRH